MRFSQVTLVSVSTQSTQNSIDAHSDFRISEQPLSVAGKMWDSVLL